MKKYCFFYLIIVIFSLFSCNKGEQLSLQDYQRSFKLPFEEEDFSRQMHSLAIQQLEKHDHLAQNLREPTSIIRWGVLQEEVIKYETQQGQLVYIAPFRNEENFSLKFTLVGYYTDKINFFVLKPNSQYDIFSLALGESFSHFIHNYATYNRYELPECYVHVPCSGIEIMCIKEIDCDYGSGGVSTSGPNGIPIPSSSSGGATGSPPVNPTPPDDPISIEDDIERLEEKMIRFLAQDLVGYLGLTFNDIEEELITNSINTECLSSPNPLDCAYEDITNLLFSSLDLSLQHQLSITQKPTIVGQALKMLEQFDEYTTEINTACQIVLDMVDNSQLYDNSYINTVTDYEGCNPEIFDACFRVEVGFTKIEQPNLSPENTAFWSLFNTIKDGLHLTLDLAGLVPVVGEIADLSNGILYTLEGDVLNASLSFAAIIPLGGQAATLSKFWNRTIIGVAGRPIKFKFITDPFGKITFGNPGQLRTVIKPPTGFQAHHIIPTAVQSDVIQQAAKSSKQFHKNEALNGIAVNSIYHGNHPTYSNYIASKLEEIRVDLISSNNYNPETAYDALLQLVNDVRTTIINNPNTHINQIFP